MIPLHGLQPWQAQSQRVQNSKSGWEYSKNRNVLRRGNAEKHDLKKHRFGIGALNKNWRNMMGVHCSFQTLKNHSTLLCRLFSSRCETLFTGLHSTWAVHGQWALKCFHKLHVKLNFLFSRPYTYLILVFQHNIQHHIHFRLQRAKQYYLLSIFGIWACLTS